MRTRSTTNEQEKHSQHKKKIYKMVTFKPREVVAIDRHGWMASGCGPMYPGA